MPTSFEKHIVPLFRTRDMSCMAGLGILLDDYSYMSDPAAGGTFPDHANARNVYARLTGTALPRMPMGGPFWSDSQIDLFSSWMEGGFQP